MRRLICLMIFSFFCLFCDCTSGQMPELEGLAVITARPDINMAFGNEKGCYRLISDAENTWGLSYIDFADNKEKIIKPELDIQQPDTANIFMAGQVLYLHTVTCDSDMGKDAWSSVLYSLSDDGVVTGKIEFPGSCVLDGLLVQDNDCIYTMLKDNSIKRKNLIKINKKDMTYEILNDFSASAQLLTAYGNCLVLQRGKDIISYDTTTGQQEVLLETDIEWIGSGDKLLASEGSYSRIEIYDIASGVLYSGKIKSSGMLANFSLYDDCMIPGYLTIGLQTEITGETAVHLLNTETLAVDKTIVGASFLYEQPMAVCGDKAVIAKMNTDTQPYEYEYRLMSTSDYINDVDKYIILDMINR